MNPFVLCPRPGNTTAALVGIEVPFHVSRKWKQGQVNNSNPPPNCWEDLFGSCPDGLIRVQVFAALIIFCFFRRKLLIAMDVGGAFRQVSEIVGFF